MMVVMTPGARGADRGRDGEQLETTGVHVVVMPGELTTAIGAIGDPEGVAELGLEGMAGSIASSRSRARTSSPAPSSATTSRPCSRSAGGPSAAARPSAWSPGRARSSPRAQTLEVARAVEQGGASMLRGGAFKPRTSPFAFKGLGRRGARDPRRGARGHRVCRWSPSCSTRPRGGDRRARRRGPDRRPQHAELRPARGRRQARQADPAQARPRARRSTSCCRRPTTCSRRATRR